MTIADKLEGLLPADGNLTTKDERVIAEAVKELREAYDDIDTLSFALECRETLADQLRAKITQQDSLLDEAEAMLLRKWREVALAFATGCIASAIFVVLV